MRELGILTVFAREAVAPVALLAAWTTLAVLNPFFLSVSNMVNIAGQVGPLAVVALGQMLVIVTGGFDVSIGAVAALATVSAALAMGKIGIAAAVVSPAVGLACGAVNGLLVGRFRIQPIIVTLGMLSFARGLALFLSGGEQAVTLPSGSTLHWLGYGEVVGVPAGLLVAGGLTAGVSLVVRRVRLGRWLYMVGSNREGAALVGVPVTASLAWAYALCGLAAGLAGLIFMGRSGAGLPTEGKGLELEAIAAAVIGGTALTGGVGKPVPVVLGALFIQSLGNGLDLAGMSPFVKEVVLGGVILCAGLLDFALRQFRGAQLSRKGGSS